MGNRVILIQCDPNQDSKNPFFVLSIRTIYIHTYMFFSQIICKKSIGFHSFIRSFFLYLYQTTVNWQWRWRRCITERKKPNKLIIYPTVFSFLEVHLHLNHALNSIFQFVPSRVLFNSFFQKVWNLMNLWLVQLWYLKHLRHCVLIDWCKFCKKIGYFYMFIRMIGLGR